MSKYLIGNICEPDDSILESEDLILWVLHADKIPPHIGLSKNGYFFSLKANGKDEYKALTSLIEIVKKKSIKTLGFQLKSNLSIDVIEDIFSKFTTTSSNNITCLHPIKDVLQIYEVVKLVELLDVLYRNNNIVKVVGYGVDDSFDGIEDYNLNEIHRRLKLLEDGK